MEIGTQHTIYVKAFTNEEWLGAWAPVRAQLEWQDPESDTALFRLTPNDLEADDEYEFYEPGTLVLARREAPEQGFRVGVGMAPEKEERDDLSRPT